MIFEDVNTCYMHDFRKVHLSMNSTMNIDYKYALNNTDTFLLFEIEICKEAGYSTLISLLFICQPH